MDGCTDQLIEACKWGCASGRCQGVPSPDATLKAKPSLVHPRDTSQISWTSKNVTACTVTGTNGDSWTALSSTGTTTSPILSQTTFTLRCQGYAGALSSSISRSVDVGIPPGWAEK